MEAARRLPARRFTPSLLRITHGIRRFQPILNATRLAGHDMLKGLGIAIIPASAPDFFTEDTPTAVLVRQVLGAIDQFEKASAVAKLAAARKRKREREGRCEGRKPRFTHTSGHAHRKRRLSAKCQKQARCEPWCEDQTDKMELNLSAAAGGDSP
jgi:hypothetical protein